MARNNKIAVPQSHVDDAEKLIEEMKKTLSNLKDLRRDIRELTTTKEKSFKINE